MGHVRQRIAPQHHVWVEWNTRGNGEAITVRAWTRWGAILAAKLECHRRHPGAKIIFVGTVRV